jgi:CheY-like chemotaxis protein
MNPVQQDPAPLVAIVDDEEDITTYLRLALEDRGYRVVAINEVSGAVDLLSSSRPDLVCLDLLMPGKTGISLYSELARHPVLRDIPIVILSGLAVREELPGILEQAGGLPQPARFVEKPVEIDEFLALVEEILGQRLRVSS